MAYEAYIDENFYNSIYNGAEIDSTVFSRIAKRASDEIDKLTFNRVRTEGLSSFSENIQEKIKLAVCAYAEMLSQIETATDGTGIRGTSEKVGSYSYLVDAQSIKDVLVDAKIKAKSFMVDTGLLYAGFDI